MPNIRSADELRSAIEEAERVRGPESASWREDLARFLSQVANANEQERASLEFQQRLWETNPVTDVGMGTVNIDAAIADDEFRRWLAGASLRAIPSRERSAERVDALAELADEILEKLEAHCSRKPVLKLFRVLAAFFPEDFTSISDVRRLRELHQAMFSQGRAASPCHRHAEILRRFDEVSGGVSDLKGDFASLAGRMSRPWLVYKTAVRPEPESAETKKGAEGGSPIAALQPLPATRRRKGLTAIRGSFKMVLQILEFTSGGVTKEELYDELRSTVPEVKDNSLAMMINVLRKELCVLQRDGDLFKPNETGEALLDSGDPSELRDGLITRILGVDHGLVALRDRGPMTRQELIAAIWVANPGWKGERAPTTITHWLRSMGVIAPDSDSGKLALTERGRDWAAAVHWTPEPLLAGDLEDEEEETGVVVGAGTQTGTFSVPAAVDVVSRINAGENPFPSSTIVTLHAGLWANHRRHFAVLTGLSGSGKTQLARAYARALLGTDANANRRFLAVAVQPGWYDPSPLVGYVNPLRGGSYMRPKFLDLLIQAGRDPANAYVALLDEMNLSHPEQYLAPLLSAMELEDGVIELHGQADALDGVPTSIPYPKNLVLIGTVNMDETTHGLSDKVLDRAFTLEFWDINLADYPRWTGRALSGARVRSAQRVLEDLLAALAPARLHFGWRVVDDVLDFLVQTEAAGDALGEVQALDTVVYTKILPKLRGDDSRRFREALERCRKALEEHGLERSARKVQDLQQDLETTGSARFWR